MYNRAKRNKRKKQVGLITNIIFCLMTLAALTGCIVLLLQNYWLRNQEQEAMSRIEEYEQEQEEHVYSQEDLEAGIDEGFQFGYSSGREDVLDELKQSMSTGDPTAHVLRSFYPQDVVVFSDGKYTFFPILDSLKKHGYVYDNFLVEEDGEIVYVDDAQTVLSKKGIDVSRHQGDIDWRAVAGDGITYAFIRVGYRGNTGGALVEDEFFKDNIKGALDNGIQVGVYFYTQALTPDEAVEEAEFLLDLIEPYNGVTYPVVLDLEETGSSTTRTAEMTQQEYTQAAIAFCETIEQAGYVPMIYGNLKTFMIMLDLEQLEKYEKWFAYYDDTVYFPYDFGIWQYSSTGSVDGIKGDVDLNVCMKEFGQG